MLKSLKKEKTVVAEAKKEEKASAASGSIINSAKAEGHTRGFIAEHGDTEFRRCQGGFLPPSSRTTPRGHIRLENIPPKVN